MFLFPFWCEIKKRYAIGDRRSNREEKNQDLFYQRSIDDHCPFCVCASVWQGVSLFTTDHWFCKTRACKRHHLDPKWDRI